MHWTRKTRKHKEQTAARPVWRVGERAFGAWVTGCQHSVIPMCFHFFLGLWDTASSKYIVFAIQVISTSGYSRTRPICPDITSSYLLEESKTPAAILHQALLPSPTGHVRTSSCVTQGPR